MHAVPYYSAPSTPLLKAEKSRDFPLLAIIIFVCLCHLAFLWFSSLPSSPILKKTTAQKLVVKTIKLNPITPAASSIQPSLALQQEQQGTQPKKEEIKELKTEATPEKIPEPIPVSMPVKVEEPALPPQPAPVLPPKLEPEVQKEQPPKVESTPVKPIEPPKNPPKVTPKPQKKPAPAPKTTPKETKKTEPIKKQAPLAKVQPDPPKPPKPVKKEPTPEEIAAREAEKQRELEIAAAKEAARQREQEALEKVKQSFAKIKDSGDKIGGVKLASLDSTAIPKQIEQLQIDALPVGSTVPVDLSAKEVSYRDEIAYRLKMALKLPDYGEVKIKLTLDRSGKVASVQSVHAESTKNKQYIEKTVPSLIFPPFGTNFAQAAQYTFMITLNNDH